MINKQIYKTSLSLIFTILAVLNIYEPAKCTEKVYIKNLKYANNVLNIETTSNLEKNDLIPNIRRMGNPDRIVVDIPSSILIPVKVELPVEKNDSAISLIKAAQFSVNPDMVRVVIYSSSETAKKTKALSFKKNLSDFILTLDNDANKNLKPIKPVLKENKAVSYVKAIEIKPKPPVDVINSLPKKSNEIKNKTLNNEKIKTENNPKEAKMVINSVKLSENNFVISGNGHFGEKRFFTLDNPNRLVYDFDDTTIASPELFKTYTLKNKDTIKLGQFTKNSVRVVITTENNENFKSYLSSKMNKFIFSADKNNNFYNIEKPEVTGNISNIKVENLTPEITSVKITSSVPAIYNFFRSDSNEFKLELYNLSKPANKLLALLNSNDNIKGTKIETLSKIKDSTVFNFPINSNIRAEIKVAEDGKNIELLFKNKYKKTFLTPLTPKNQDLAPKNDDLTQRKMIISPLIRKVVIDPGHGGSDVGATRAGIFEKDINLDVSMRLAKYLEKAGITVVFTRKTDEAVSLKDRTVITNNENPDLFLSVHVNSSTSSIPKGIETHWYTPQSKEAASFVQDKLTGAVNSNNRGICNSMFYVIHHTEAPAILVEIGFISNDNERNELLTSNRQDATAKAIADGVLKFMENKYKP